MLHDKCRVNKHYSAHNCVCSARRLGADPAQVMQAFPGAFSEVEADPFLMVRFLLQKHTAAGALHLPRTRPSAATNAVRLFRAVQEQGARDGPGRV